MEQKNSLLNKENENIEKLKNKIEQKESDLDKSKESKEKLETLANTRDRLTE
ncbi:MAG: hypothetical protein K9M80_06570 [Candidatus Marinimicrobia bacterium]|nr:hypothetical protein [Candidatus Neomarinimicrobiota bacterium]